MSKVLPDDFRRGSLHSDEPYRNSNSSIKLDLVSDINLIRNYSLRFARRICGGDHTGTSIFLFLVPLNGKIGYWKKFVYNKSGVGHSETDWIDHDEEDYWMNIVHKNSPSARYQSRRVSKNISSIRVSKKQTTENKNKKRNNESYGDNRNRSIDEICRNITPYSSMIDCYAEKGAGWEYGNSGFGNGRKEKQKPLKKQKRRSQDDERKITYLDPGQIRNRRPLADYHSGSHLW